MSREPKTFLVGFTSIDWEGLKAYLHATEQQDFLYSAEAAKTQGLSDGEILVSTYAKMCYKSLVLGKNANISRVRDVRENLQGTIASGHGSVFEHATLNFVTTDCSRVFTHELVRHRVGTAFSQTSGRYCTVEDAELVLPPELEEAIYEEGRGDEDHVTIADDMEALLQDIKNRVAEYRFKLKLDEPGGDFARKKRLTSALRRIMPNGATNEIGWSVNLRSLRHLIEMRTSRHAEWEIRLVFNQVADIVLHRWPSILHGGTNSRVDGLTEWTGLKV